MAGWGRRARARADAHGKLLVVNLFILREKTATGYPDTILNMLRNKAGRARALQNLQPGGQPAARVFSAILDQKMRNARFNTVKT